ncbi:MAG: Phosphoribosylglycinamide formyltransferase [Ignavibacteria bacterium]|nr:Phosphoribosylglycinamide formyltransferase [Ignavibacteria bacterium]
MKICVFASGTGTNFKAIIDSIKKGYLRSKINLLISNNPNCNAVKIAASHGINFEIISNQLYKTIPQKELARIFLKILKKHKSDFIVLAGFMKFIPVEVVNKFRNKIINIHPALLPLFGGKGMFGINVHRAVIKSGVKVSGITIHFVNEIYDEGRIIFQKCCNVTSNDDEFTLQKKIQKLEHKYYPDIIKKFEDRKIKVREDKVWVS